MIVLNRSVLYNTLTSLFYTLYVLIIFIFFKSYQNLLPIYQLS